MKGDNFTYGSKVTFRYHLHPLQHRVVKLTVENKLNMTCLEILVELTLVLFTTAA